ncbi:MAG: polysulfide reductase NrfD [Rhodocyclaceae bacterium]|nr:polysulfide reductase NrfD [Rhodocyclaceae bacterium]
MRDTFQRIEERSFYALVVFGLLLVMVGLGAVYYMEEHGHAVTGMNNQVVWGMPHVFAIFLITAASGVLNVASIGSVFGKPVYKARAPLSGLLSLTMLAGGLMVLMLDLGRPDRVIIAATHYNLTSVFAWNAILYPGLFGIVGVYIWTMMDHSMKAYSKIAGFSAFIWRFILTTGTGSIFGFLVARQAYQSAVLAPMFIVMSFAWGLAVFLLVQSSMYLWNGVALPPPIQRRMTRLLGIFIAGALYFVLVYHMTNLYFSRQEAFEHFILLDGGIFPILFWGGFVLLGSILPLALLLHPELGGRRATILASLLVIFGALCHLYVFIIGGEVYPLDIFPGFSAASTFGDGVVGQYAPSLPEFLLGIGGLALAFVATVIGVRILRFMPQDDFTILTGGKNVH